MNENINFCQPPLPVEQPPPFLPDFLACFPLLFSRRNLIPSFHAPEGQCHFLCLSQCLPECWGPQAAHQSWGWLASPGATAQPLGKHWRMGHGLCVPSQASAAFSSLHHSRWGSPTWQGLLWKPGWQSSVDQEPEKNNPLPFSGGTGRLVALPTCSHSKEASEMAFRAAQLILPWDLVGVCHLAKEVPCWPEQPLCLWHFTTRVSLAWVRSWPTIFSCRWGRGEGLVLLHFVVFQKCENRKGGSWAKQEQREILLLLRGVAGAVWVSVLGEPGREKLLSIQQRKHCFV